MLRQLLGRLKRQVQRALTRAGFALVDHLPKQQVAAALEERLGLLVMAPHYYSPIPEESDFQEGFWDELSELPGIAIDVEACLELAREPLAPFLEEFRKQFPIQKPSKGSPFYLLNGVYMAVDAHVYYAMIRHLKPKRVLEIGCGMSTLLAIQAARRNGTEGSPCRILAIEPFPPKHVRRAAGDGEIELRAERVQQIPLSEFEDLGDGDILFIDSTHVLREGNDVQMEYLEILPRLNSGVHVHIHDVSLPRRYPKCYFDQKLYWNEQYLLQAFLCGNTAFEITWPGNLLLTRVFIE